LVSQMLMHKQRQLEREQIHAWNKNKWRNESSDMPMLRKWMHKWKWIK
jgi:hypothetical protein